jgi:hypothetical protein
MRARAIAHICCLPPLRVPANYRDYHGSTQSNDWRMSVDPIDQGINVVAYPEATLIYLLSSALQELLYEHSHLCVSKTTNSDAALRCLSKVFELPGYFLSLSSKMSQTFVERINQLQADLSRTEAALR